MNVTIDESCDMGYIYLQDNQVQSDHTIAVEDKGDLAFVLDIDSSGRLIGIEIFSASKRMPKEMLAIAEQLDNTILVSESTSKIPLVEALYTFVIPEKK
jgi:uncharacterized protein YuzE